MKIFGLKEINKVLPKLDLLPLIKEGFRAYSLGLAVVPPVGELVFDKPQGDVHIKYGYIKGDDYYVIKIASGFYGDVSSGILPTQGGVMLLFDQKTGKKVGILVDECHLTNVRTAVAGGICAELLAPKKIDSIGVIGTGVQARMQVNYISNIIECKKVKVWGRSKISVEKYIEEMSDGELELSNATHTDEIAESCNLIITTTPSKIPLINFDSVPVKKICEIFKYSLMIIFLGTFGPNLISYIARFKIACINLSSLSRLLDAVRLVLINKSICCEFSKKPFKIFFA